MTCLCFQGNGTDEDSLDRIITTRADKDLKLIIEAFEDMEIVSGTLKSWIEVSYLIGLHLDGQWTLLGRWRP